MDRSDFVQAAKYHAAELCKNLDMVYSCKHCPMYVSGKCILTLVGGLE